MPRCCCIAESAKSTNFKVDDGTGFFQKRGKKHTLGGVETRQVAACDTSCAMQCHCEGGCLHVRLASHCELFWDWTPDQLGSSHARRTASTQTTQENATRRDTIQDVRCLLSSSWVRAWHWCRLRAMAAGTLKSAIRRVLLCEARPVASKERMLHQAALYSQACQNEVNGSRFLDGAHVRQGTSHVLHEVDGTL